MEQLKIGKEEEDILLSQAGDSFQVFSVRGYFYFFSRSQPVKMAGWYLMGPYEIMKEHHMFNVNVKKSIDGGNEVSTVDQELLKIAKHFKPPNQKMSFPPGFYTFCWSWYYGEDDFREVISKNDGNGNNQTEKETSIEDDEEFEHSGEQTVCYEEWADMEYPEDA